MRAYLLVFAAVLSPLAPAWGGPAKPLDSTQIETWCQGAKADSAARYFTEVENFAFLPYDADLLLLPLDGSRSLKALSGAVELVPASAPLLEADVAPEAAKALLSLAKAGRLGAR